MEESFIFFPERELEASPGELGLPFEDLHFRAEDGPLLHAWLIPGKGNPVSLLWFHGNAGNISHRLENILLLRERLPLNIFIFDYRGYGRSEGRPTEEGTYLDGRAALAALREREEVDPARVVFFGRSLGSAVAVELALHEPPLGLILEAPFTSIKELARRFLPFPALASLVRTGYNSICKISKVRAPLLIIHGEQDEVVPIEQGRRLFHEAPGTKRFYAVLGAGHNDCYIVGGEPYFREIENFIGELEPRGERS